MPRVTTFNRATFPVEPVSVTPRTAAKMLDLAYDTVRRLVDSEVFTRISSSHRGVGKRYYLHTDEVRLYGETRSEDAVKKLRQEKRRMPLRKAK